VAGANTRPSASKRAGPPDAENAGGDSAQQKPAERGERQQVHQLVGARMQQPPQWEQEQEGGHGGEDHHPAGQEAPGASPRT
jgi:hypothetical protein